MKNLNGFLTLKDIVYWIAIVVALVGPYLVHERRIGDMASDIAVLKFQVGEIKEAVNRLEESRRVSWEQ